MTIVTLPVGAGQRRNGHGFVPAPGVGIDREVGQQLLFGVDGCRSRRCRCSRAHNCGSAGQLE